MTTPRPKTPNDQLALDRIRRKLATPPASPVTPDDPHITDGATAHLTADQRANALRRRANALRRRANARSISSQGNAA